MSIWIPYQMCSWQWLPLVCRLSLNYNDFLWCEEAFQFHISLWSILVIISWAAGLCFWKSLLLPTFWRCLQPSWGCCGMPSLPEEGAVYVLAVPAPLHSPLRPTDVLRAKLPLFTGFMSPCVESHAALSQVLCHPGWNHVLLCLLVITTPATGHSLGTVPQRMSLSFLLLQEGRVRESAQGLKSPQLQIGWWAKGHRGPEQCTNSLSYVKVQASWVPFFSHLSPARVLRILWFVGIF